jgi:GT2 family glycosyltransferase
MAKNQYLSWSDEVDHFYKYRTEHEDDQNFLENKLYRSFIQDCIIHDEIKNYEGLMCRPFPIPYEKDCHFVGCYVSHDGIVDVQTTNVLRLYLQHNAPNRITTSDKSYNNLLTDIASRINHIYTQEKSSVSETLLDKIIPVSTYNGEQSRKGIFLVVKKGVSLTPSFVYEFSDIFETYTEYWEIIDFEKFYLVNNYRPPKISVIIPTFNRYKYLLNAISSVKAQTYKHIELIIVNDGSTTTDYYSNELRTLLPPRTTLIHLTTNSGEFLNNKIGKAAHTKNVGLKVATGDYIAFLDDDDYWLPNKLEKQISAMEKTNCKMSCTDGYIGKGIYDQQTVYPRYHFEYPDHLSYYKAIGIRSFPEIWSKDFLQIHNFCINSSVIIHKDVISKIGSIPYKNMGEDYSYWIKAIQHTNCVYVDCPLVYYDSAHGDGQLY